MNETKGFKAWLETKNGRLTMDLVIGIGAPLLSLVILIVMLNLGTPGSISFIISAVLITVNTFLCVKCFRMKHNLAAVLILCLMTPMVLMILLFGACIWMMSGGY